MLHAFCLFICTLFVSNCVFFPELSESRLHTLHLASPEHKDIFLHEHSVVSNLRTFTIYEVLVSNCLPCFCSASGLNDPCMATWTPYSRKLRPRTSHRVPALQNHEWGDWV